MITFILAVCGNVDYVYSFPQSPPSRAAWIEILQNTIAVLPAARRRLHGRRGLKYRRIEQAEPVRVAAFTGGVYKNFEPPFDNWTFDLF